MRVRVLMMIAITTAACGGSEHALPGAIAPTTPPIVVTAADLLPVGPTTFVGTPGGSTVLRVRAVRADGGPAYAVTVVFKVQAGGGAVQPIIASTDEQGIASAKWTFGPEAAINLATATGALTPAPVSFTVSTFPADAGSAP